MSILNRLACATLMVLTFALPGFAQEASLTISTTTGPESATPDPRAGYNGWLSNQAGVTETLIGLDYEMQMYPRVAEKIEQVSPTSWRVTLRGGMTFHDGSPVVAQTVVDGIKPISEEGHAGYNARIASLLDLADVRAEDERTIVFDTNAPNAAFPWSLTDPGIAVLGPVSEEFPINATGPFIFREAVPEQFYVAKANPDYRLGAPALAEVRVVVAADPASAALAFEAGEVDLVINYPETDYERILGTGAEGFAAPTTRLYFYSMNVTDGPLTNPLIRRAVSLAIDRQGIVEAALSGVGGVPAGTIFPAGLGWAADIKPNYDPQEAERLLAEAGAVKEGETWMLDGEPLTLDIVTYDSRASLPATAELTQAFLQAIGIKANVRIGEYGASNDAIAEGSADLFLQAWVSTPQGDPGAFPESLVASKGDSNAGGYANPELDKLLADGRTSFEPEKRKEIYDRVQEIIAQETALIPVFHVSQINVGRKGINNYKVHPTETYWMTHEVSLSE